MRGVGKGERRDVAVAVNGRIRAVSRTVHIRRISGEYYSFLVPPTSFVARRRT